MHGRCARVPIAPVGAPHARTPRKAERLLAGLARPQMTMLRATPVGVTSSSRHGWLRGHVRSRYRHRAQVYGERTSPASFSGKRAYCFRRSEGAQQMPTSRGFALRSAAGVHMGPGARAAPRFSRSHSGSAPFCAIAPVCDALPPPDTSGGPAEESSSGSNYGSATEIADLRSTALARHQARGHT